MSACPVSLNPTLNHAPVRVLLASSPVSFSCYFGNPFIFISYLNVFQLPLADLPLNHPPSPALRYFFYHSLFFDFHQTESRLSFTLAFFHFISFDDNLSFPLRLPRSSALFPRQVPFLQ